MRNNIHQVVNMEQNGLMLGLTLDGRSALVVIYGKRNFVMVCAWVGLNITSTSVLFCYLKAVSLLLSYQLTDHPHKQHCHPTR